MNKNSGWFEIMIPCDSECREAVSNFLFEQGASGTVDGEDRVAGSFSPAVDAAQVLRSTKHFCAALREMGFRPGLPEMRSIAVEDWSRKWREQFRPIIVTSKI